MLPLFNKFQLLMSPEIGNTGVPGAMGAQDILSELLKDDSDAPEVIDLTPPAPKKEEKVEDEDDENKDDNKGKKKDTKEEKDDEEDKKEEDEELDELAELEKELQGPDEKQLELMTPARRKDILTKYPKLFKDFPYLETAYYRDQKFTEVFPTIKEAEEAAQSVKSFNDLQAKLKTGDIEQVITDVKKDEKAFFKMVDNYMPVLAKVAPEAYHHIVGNLIKYTIEEMITEAKNTKNEALANVAGGLHTFVFGNTKWTPPTNLSSNINPNESKAESELAKREREFAERRFNTALNEITTKVDNSVKATIDLHIDPNKQMTDFVKQAAVKQALADVERLIKADTRFAAILDRLWQNAADKDFAKAEMDKIKSACVSKARTLLPSVIKTARNQALKGLGKRAKEENDNSQNDNNTDDDKGTPRPRNSGGHRSSSVSKDKYAGMSIQEAMLLDD